MLTRNVHFALGCRLQLTTDVAKDLYSEHKDAFFYARLLRHICSGPSVAMRLELRRGEGYARSSDSLEENSSPDAINRWRTLLGPSKLFANIYLSSNGEFDQIRHTNFRQMFALSDTRNFCHGSDSFPTLYKEYGLFEKQMKPVEYPEIELFALDEFTLEDEYYDQ